MTTGTLSAGFEFTDLGLAFITHAKTAAQHRRRQRRDPNRKAVRDISDLTVGDYVVHSAHGIGIFSGIVKRTIQGVTKDYLQIKYAGTDTLFEPVTQLDLVARYVGPREDVDLCAVARRVLDRLAEAAEQKQVTLSLTGGGAVVRSVPRIVEEILYNLCDNAVVYNRPGGSVTVTVDDAPGGARVRVADTGVGIPREAQERVFERFYRVDKSHSGGGTGLGLSIVKHGAAYLGARVSLESREGIGSTFTVTFPPAENQDCAGGGGVVS